MKFFFAVVVGIALGCGPNNRLCAQPIKIDPDFYTFKKQADACFAKADYACARQNYKAALVVKADDEYCKIQLAKTEKLAAVPAKPKLNGSATSTQSLATFDWGGSFSEGLASVRKYGGQYGFIDKIGRWVIKPQFDNAHVFSEGLAYVKKDGQYGFIDKMGRWITKTQFDDPHDFSEGLARVKKDGQYGFIDKTGQIVIEPQFYYTYEFSEGLALVNNNDKYGFIDKTGRWIIKPQFDNGDDFDEGLARVEKNDKWFYINKTGKCVINCP